MSTSFDIRKLTQNPYNIKSLFNTDFLYSFAFATDIDYSMNWRSFYQVSDLKFLPLTANSAVAGATSDLQNE
jgi:hypothetical protein